MGADKGIFSRPLFSPLLSSPLLPSPLLSPELLYFPLLSSPPLPCPLLYSPPLPFPVLSSPPLPSPILSSPLNSSTLLSSLLVLILLYLFSNIGFLITGVSLISSIIPSLPVPILCTPRWLTLWYPWAMITSLLNSSTSKCLLYLWGVSPRWPWKELTNRV